MIAVPKMMEDCRVLTPSDLPAFWANELTAESMLDELDSCSLVEGKIDVGGGKSSLADKLLQSQETYARYDFVIYFASTSAILMERSPFKNAGTIPVPWVYLEPRPREICGSFDAEWQNLETRGCAAFAKKKLCGNCPNNSKSKPCSWPVSLKEKVKNAKLVLCTDQRLLIDPMLIRKLRKYKGKTLAIIDEAQFLNESQRRVIKVIELKMFSDVLSLLLNSGSSLCQKYNLLIQSLFNDSQSLPVIIPKMPPLGKLSELVQETGFKHYGKKFRYIGHDLGRFSCAHPRERWKDQNGNIVFIARVCMADSNLVLSAHAQPEYLKHRLGMDEISLPFAGLRIQHPETRIYNIKSRRGMMQYFPKNMKQLLDFFSVLIKRNIEANRSTVVISKKIFKPRCAEYIKVKLASWGIDVQIICEPPYPENVLPNVIPAIHYGVVGVNTFSDYQCCYCLNGYYISSDALQKSLQEYEPDDVHYKLNILCDSRLTRRVVFDNPKIVDAEYLDLADAYHRQSEIDPVIQAVGRVRFYTKAREVVFFQANDLTPDLGDDVVEFKTIEAARKYFGLPRSIDIDHSTAARRLSEAMAGGISMRQAAEQLGISKSTASRILRRFRQKEPP